MTNEADKATKNKEKYELLIKETNILKVKLDADDAAREAVKEKEKLIAKALKLKEKNEQKNRDAAYKEFMKGAAKRNKKLPTCSEKRCSSYAFVTDLDC
jgi:hypothetical protein